MNRSTYIKRHTGILLLYSGVSVLLILVIILGLIKPKLKVLGEIKKEIAALNISLERYSSFGDIIVEFEGKSSEIIAINRDFHGNLIKGNIIEQRFLTEISRITKSAGIKINKIMSEGASSWRGNKYKKHVWHLDFITNFKNLNKFLFFLETNKVFLGVEQIAVKSGKNKPLHKVDISVYTIIPDGGELKIVESDYSNFSSTEIFHLPVKTVDMIDRIKKVKEEMTVQAEIKKDILYVGDTIFPELKNKKKKGGSAKTVAMPKIQLQAIVWDPQAPNVIIDGEVLSPGDTIKGIKIGKITETGVSVKWHGKWRRLTLD